jgi:diguanylate cyclase (GGDEF)-like protein
MNTPLRLLLIDDDEIDRKAVVRALRQPSLSLEILQCATASEGLRLAAAEHFDSILLDYRLPDQDGIEVLHALRSGRFEGVAVIMLSRQEDPVIAENCLDAGAQDYLLKDEVNGRRLTRAVMQARQRYLMEEALRASHEELRILSERDVLTGLANRRGFEIALNGALDRAKRGQGGLAVLLLDLDDFKSINDTLGHSIGDDLLIEITRRMRQVVRNDDFLCRLGGDEFVVVARNLERDEQAALLGDRLIGAFREPIMLSSLELMITASIGVAVLGDSSENATDLLKHADVAMYRAKRDGGNQYRFYSEKLHEAVQHLVNMKRDLHKALERGEFRVFYQPQFNAKTRTLSGMEALIRWSHPRLGLLAPGDFITITEDTGLIIGIGNWVMREACKQLKDWQQRLPEQCEHLTVAVNLSAVQLMHSGLLQKVESVLVDNQLNADRLELEITENALIEDQKGAVATLSQLSAHGITLSLDDFGTGYSSLQHLKFFPIKVLKIDKEFVSAIGHGVANDRLLIAMIRFAQALELTVVAEGVETKEQAAFCAKNGCDILQGYYYSKPIQAAEFEKIFLQEQAFSHDVGKSGALPTVAHHK